MSHHKGSTVFWLLAVVMVVALVLMPLTACGKGTPKATTEPIRVGVLFSATGSYAQFGEWGRKAVLFAIDEVNAEGGIKGRPIKAFIYDDESKPDLSTSLTKKLIQQDQVVAIIGPASALVHAGVAAVANDLKVPVVAVNGGFVTVIRKELWPYNFTSWYDGNNIGLGLLQYFRSKGVTRFAAFCMTGFESIVDNLKAMGKAMGMELTIAAFQPATDVDATPSILKIKATNPEMIINIVTGPLSIAFFNGTEQQGLKVPIGVMGANVTPQAFKGVDPALTGRMFEVQGRGLDYKGLKDDDPFKPFLTQLNATYRARTGANMNYYEAVAYDAALPVITALKAVGPDPQKIRDHIEKGQKNLMGASGFYWNKSPEDHQGGNLIDTVATLWDVKAGSFKFITYMTDIRAQLKSQGIPIIESLEAFSGAK